MAEIQVETIYTYVNDTAPAVNFNITRENFGVVDLSGCTVNFYIQNPLTSKRTNTGHTLCTITDGEGGKCRYAWQAGDIPVEGIYNSAIKITYVDGTVESAPVSIEVAATV